VGLACPAQRGYSRAVRETDEEIREIKKEIIESRGLTIKTNNLVNSLGADIKSIAKRQAGYERRFNWNGAVAYALFAALSFGGLKLASDATIAAIESEKLALESRNTDLRRALLEERQRADDRSAAEARAARFYDLIRQEKRREVVTRYDTIAEDTHISRAEAQFFRDFYERFRLDLSIEAYQVGLDLVRTGRYAEAADKLEEAIRLKEDAPHVPAMKYELAAPCAASGGRPRPSSTPARWRSRPPRRSSRTTPCSWPRCAPKSWVTSTTPSRATSR
jgi:TolA-binding protein